MSGPPAPPPPPPPPSSMPPNKFDNSKPTPAPSVMLNRDALLGQIRQGITLKKTETNDRSAPRISGGGGVVASSPQNISKSGSSSSGGGSSSSSKLAVPPLASAPVPPVPQLGDILAGGIPKLKHVNPISGSAPHVPTNRPTGKSHQKKSSISYNAPPIPTGAPPIPTTITNTSHSKKESISSLPPIAPPPPPPPQPPTFAAPSTPHISTATIPAAPPAPPIPSMPAPSTSTIPAAPPAPPIPISAAPAVPSAPPPPPILNTSSVTNTSTSQSPPPPMPGLVSSKEESKFTPKKSSKSSSSKSSSSKLAPISSGGQLPFLAEIQKKRDDRFVVSQDSNYSTYVEQEPVTQSNSFSSSSLGKSSTGPAGGSMSFLSEIESKMKKGHSHPSAGLPTKAPPIPPAAAPPIPPAAAPPIPPAAAPPLPTSAPPIPSSTTNMSTNNNTSTHLPESNSSFANQIASQILHKQKLHHVTPEKEFNDNVKPSVPSTKAPLPPPVTSAPPLPTSPPPAPSAPVPILHTIPVTSTIPTKPSPPNIPTQVAPDIPIAPAPPVPSTLNQQIHSSHVPPPPPPPPPSSSTTINTTYNDTASTISINNDTSMTKSSASSVKHRLFASEGSFSTTKIDPSAYTISGSSTTSKISGTAKNNTESPSSDGGSGNNSKVKIMIDDSRFNWSINESQMPAPRKFQNVTKLYPSGGGSTIPLDLSLYE